MVGPVATMGQSHVDRDLENRCQREVCIGLNMLCAVHDVCCYVSCREREDYHLYDTVNISDRDTALTS